MLNGRSIATFLAMVLFAAPAWAQAQIPKQSPTVPPLAPAVRPPALVPASSLSVAGRFWDIGYELAHSESLTGPQADQAIIFLTAAELLNSQIAGVEPLLLKLAARHSEKDYSDPIVFWLQKYVSESADRTIVADAIRSMLNRSSVPDERRALLEKVALKIKDKNLAINSDLAASLGLLMQEKGVTEQAKWYLVQAYNNNKFNRTAFTKLAEIAPNEVTPAASLEHLRLMVRENPLDLNAALAFAGYAERLQLHEIAAPSYQYCAELFRYLYPSEPLPPHIYLPWAISCYNTPQGADICVQIAENIRSLKRFDILLEAIAGRAALKLGKQDEARQIFQQAEQRAQELLQLGPGQPQTAEQGGVDPVRPPNAKQLAWFYSFADVNPAAALDWANKAYSAEPNSPSASALFAYALSINNRLELAGSLLASAEQSQIVDLVRARTQLALGNKPAAIETVKTAIAKDAGSLAAEKARELLRELGSVYTPPVDPRPLVTFLVDHLGKATIPQFVAPEQMLGVQFTVRGADFSYGNEIEGIVAVANRSAEPLIITESSLFQGTIRVSARVSGDLQRDIPNLISEAIRTDLAVPPSRSLVHVLRLSTGELRELLLNHPQANLQIQFTLYLDPVVTDRGEISNRLVDIKPATVSVTRPRVPITGDYLQSRFKIAGSGQEAQKIQTARLFTGMLKEQRIMTERGALYNFQYAPALPGQLRASLTGASGLLLGGADSEWAVRVNTMADLLSLPLDQELAGVVLKNVNHPQWPVRLMAVYLLAKGTPNSVGSVLDWVVQNEKDDLVRSMAVSLQSTSTGATPAPRLLISQPAPAAHP
jgi:hypothetical protein